MSKNKKIFNVPSNYSFLDSLTKFITEKFQEESPCATIILPNKRSCVELRNIFKEKNISRSTPNIISVSDISIKEFKYLLKQNSKILDIIAQIEKKSFLSDIAYLFLIAKEIKNYSHLKKITFSESISLASSLKSLFDDADKYKMDIERIYEIDDSNMSKHRQFGIEFIKNCYITIHNKTIKELKYSSSSLQNFTILALAELIKEFGLQKNIVIAGLSSAVEYIKILIESVFNDEKGDLIISGFSKEFATKNQKEAQYLLTDMLDFLKYNHLSVENIEYFEFKNCDERRLEFAKYLTISSDKSYLWYEKQFDNEFLRQDLQKNFTLIESRNEVLEVKSIIKSAIKHAKSNKKVGIIVNSEKFSQILKSELNSLQVGYSDFRSLKIKNSQFLNLFFLITELIVNGYDSYILLSIFKHPYFSAQDFDINIIEEFEEKILRKSRSSDDFNGILQRSHIVENKEISKFFDLFYQKFQSTNFKSQDIEIKDFLEKIKRFICEISNSSFELLIDLDQAKKEINSVFTELEKYQNFYLTKVEIADFFTKIFSQQSYFVKSSPKSLIQIMSPIEARLLNFDLLILTSLNHGNFPEISDHGWIGEKIKAQLGIDLSNIKYGQNCYDLCNYFAQRKIIISRSLQEENSLTLESSFISRLKLLLKKIDYQENVTKGKNNLKYNLSETLQEQDPEFAKIKPEDNLKRFSVSDIVKLISDPYQVYAKKILKLEKIEKIDYKASHREFGNFVHKALEEYVKNKAKNFDEFEKEAFQIFRLYFTDEDAKNIWWPRFINILHDFTKENDKLDYQENFTEIKAVVNIFESEIIAKIDRISIDKNNAIDIFDYKTGHIPEKKNVLGAKEPQLALYALLIVFGEVFDQNLANLIRNNQNISLNYWKLSSFSDSKIQKICANNITNEVIEAAKNGLGEIISYYKQEDSTFKIAKNQSKKHDFLHLERIIL